MSASGHMPSPLEHMIGTMNADRKNTGMSCQIKRRLPDGSLQDADPRALDALGTKSRMAYAAQNLKNMSRASRTEWALEMKTFANTLYAQGSIVEAMEKYVEALAASDFGKMKSPDAVKEREGGGKGAGASNTTNTATTTNTTIADVVPAVDRPDLPLPTVQEEAEDVDLDLSAVGSHCVSADNVDALVVPVLCNLAACCLTLKQHSKARKFCDAALELRPRCAKALMRRGMALVHLGEHQQATAALRAALDLALVSQDGEDDVIELCRAGSSGVGAGAGEAVDVSDSRRRTVMPISDGDRLRIPLLLERAEAGRRLVARGQQNQRKQMQRVFGGDQKEKGKPTAAVAVAAATEAEADAVAAGSPATAATGSFGGMICMWIAVLSVLVWVCRQTLH